MIETDNDEALLKIMSCFFSSMELPSIDIKLLAKKSNYNKIFKLL